MLTMFYSYKYTLLQSLSVLTFVVDFSSTNDASESSFSLFNIMDPYTEIDI